MSTGAAKLVQSAAASWVAASCPILLYLGQRLLIGGARRNFLGCKLLCQTVATFILPIQLRIYVEGVECGFCLSTVYFFDVKQKEKNHTIGP